MKIVLDTNVVLDLLLERKAFLLPAEEIFELAERQQIKGYLCATSITTIHYLVTKYLNKTKANQTICDLLSIFQVSQMDKVILLEATKNIGNDYEDSVIYTSASFSKMDFIITRDKKGFKNSAIPTMAPQEFLAFFKSM